MKYLVEAKVPMMFSVEADSKEEALEKMNEEWEVKVNAEGVQYNGWCDSGDWFNVEVDE